MKIVAALVLGGAFDNYGRGRVDNILKVFNVMNMTLDVDGRRVDARGIAHFTQKLDMRHAAFSTSSTWRASCTSSTRRSRCAIGESGLHSTSATNCRVR